MTNKPPPLIVKGQGLEQRLGNFAWDSTPFGPVREWPVGLKAVIRAVLDMTLPAAVLAGDQATIVGCSPAYTALSENAEDVLGKPFAALWLAADPGVREACETAGLTGKVRTVLFWSMAEQSAATAGTHYKASFTPIPDEDGLVLGLLNTVVEAVEESEGEHHEARDRLKESELRFRSLVEGIPQLVWRAREPGEWVWSSPQWEAFTGLSAEESVKDGWLQAVHPEDRAKAQAAWAQAAGRKSFSADYRILHGEERRYRWFQTRATPVHDEEGRVVEWFGTSSDIDDLRRLREHERQLLFELQHRVRNTLAAVRSIARRTAEHSRTVEDYAMHLEGRIDAFARVQSSVARDPSGTLDLAGLIADELDAAAAREGRGITLEGPEIRLGSKAAELLGLAVHELVTNGIKDGVFSPLGGHLGVTWEVEEGERLRLEWKELLMTPARHPPRRQGFGTTLLCRTLPYELKAKVDLELEDDGLRCVIDLPLEELRGEHTSPS